MDDDDCVIAGFGTRRSAYEGKRIDNARLPAGSPMHYYCRHCHVPTQTLPEVHAERPVTICDGCLLLEKRELLGEAVEVFLKKVQGKGARTTLEALPRSLVNEPERTPQ